MPIVYPYQQYQGVWTLSQASDAVAQGKWAIPPQPYLYTWGSSSYGQLGLGNITNYSSPKQVGSLKNWLSVAGGYAYSLAVKTDGTLWSWGIGAYGNLGLGNITYYSSPKQVGSLTNWSSVYSGESFSCAIKKDGTLWTWGSNDFGQLGTNNITKYSSPKQVGALTTWLTLSAGQYSIVAIQTNGTLWSWGKNNYGQLGLNISPATTYMTSSPKQVGSLTNWLNVACGSYQVLAIKTDGTLWAWGFNTSGQLGLGNITNYSSPKQVGSLTNWSSISAGNYFGMSIKTDGTLWSWGQNGGGQLGQGNIVNTSSPKQVGSLTTWSTLSVPSTNTSSMFVIKTDGTLWGWGVNNIGQLGLGNVTYYSSPKQVGSLTGWNMIAFTGNSAISIFKK